MGREFFFLLLLTDKFIALFQGVSYSSWCLGKAALFYYVTPWAFHISIFISFLGTSFVANVSKRTASIIFIVNGMTQRRVKPVSYQSKASIHYAIGYGESGHESLTYEPGYDKSCYGYGNRSTFTAHL